MNTVQVIRNEYVSPTEIVMLRGDTNYTELHFRSGKTLLVAKTLKRFEEAFAPHGFVRINKALLVNAQYVAMISSDYDRVLLKNKVELPVARRRRDTLREFIADQGVSTLIVMWAFA